MVDAHILDGDIAVIRLQETCNDGEIVAAEVDGEATLKRFFRAQGSCVAQAREQADEADPCDGRDDPWCVRGLGPKELNYGGSERHRGVSSADSHDRADEPPMRTAERHHAQWAAGAGTLAG